MLSIRSLIVASALVLSVSAAQAAEEPKKEETPVVAGEATPATTEAAPATDATAPAGEEVKKEEEKK
jgi:hypothetical protein